MTNQASRFPRPDGKRGQHIRGFVAQVQTEHGITFGTTFAVQRRPALLVTCKHVVKDVLGECTTESVVKVYFPQIKRGTIEDKTFDAQVIRMLEQYDDDVVVLKLTAVEQLPTDVGIATLGDASLSYTHEFRSFAFPDRDKYQSTWVDGTIKGHIYRPEGKDLQEEPIHLASVNLAGGVSGAPVWDLRRNLVVGVISELYDPGGSQPITDGYGVDGKVLSLAPLGLPLHDADTLPMEQDDPPPEDTRQEVARVESSIGFPLKPIYQPTEPPELQEWAGRAEMLKNIDTDYADQTVHLTGLIGFGGEGKSSIAYRWVTRNLLASENGLPQPDGVFWWSFYEDRSIENMIEALTRYLYSERNLQAIRGTAQRVNFIGALVMTRRLVLVLDGLEVMQEQSGDKFGSIKSNDLTRLLEMFAQPGHTSFCLVTSRAPLLDLLSHTAYVQRDVTRLSDNDGRELLRNLKVSGEDEQLDRIVSDWEGHALTVSLVGTYLHDQNLAVTKYHADIFGEIVETPEDENPRYWRVGYVLRQYDRHLTDADKAFLKLFSVFRLPVPESAFEKVFRTDTGSELNTPLTALEDDEFERLLQELIERRLLRKTVGEETTYSAHPLVQRHYRTALEKDHQQDEVAPVHQAVADHYQENADEPGDFPTLDDLKPYIEVVHHLCRAGAYDEAFKVHRDQIDQGSKYRLLYQLGAFETELQIMMNFFEESDITKDILVIDEVYNRLVYQIMGFCFQNLGRLRESIPIQNRAIKIASDQQNYNNLSIIYLNLSGIYRDLGELKAMKRSAEQALVQSRLVVGERERKQEERDGNSYLGWANYLLGEVEKVDEAFKQAEVLGQEIDSDKQYLYGLRGMWHADYLQRVGQADYARNVTDANLEICRSQGWRGDWSRCHRVLGDLDADIGEYETAGEHYEKAVTIAGRLEHVDVKIEAWLARGRWYAKHMNDPASALADLEQALTMALNGEYRIREADIRVALAWAYKAAGDPDKARMEAYVAKGMSQEIGYHWGQVDADAVLGSL